MDGAVDSKEDIKPPTAQKFSDDGTYTFFWLVTVEKLDCVCTRLIANLAGQTAFFPFLHWVGEKKV